MVMIVIYVDDCLTIGTEEATEKVFNVLNGSNFGLRAEDILIYYLSYNIVQDRDEGKVWTIQPHLIENL
jgi:hypothetical protein